MQIPSKEIIIGRMARNGFVESCDYFPCHPGLETCNLCFCIFYPCEDNNLGEYIISGKGTRVWSCVKCDWAHRKETVERLKTFLMDEQNCRLAPGEMRLAFINSLK